MSSTTATTDTPAYDRFLNEVARRQLEQWLPAEAVTVLDLSEAAEPLLTVMADKGHTVVHADRTTDPAVARPGVSRVMVESGTLDWARTASVDAVVAEGMAMSHALATEVTVDQLHRVLRPGGRLLVSVESLVAGLSQLAEHARWAELADVPSADVVLVPEDDGRVSRCFWPEELTTMLETAGFEVDWVRPRAVIAPAVVSAVLDADPGGMPELVETELTLARRRAGESLGSRLVASARRS